MLQNSFFPQEIWDREAVKYVAGDKVPRSAGYSDISLFGARRWQEICHSCCTEFL